MKMAELADDALFITQAQLVNSQKTLIETAKNEVLICIGEKHGNK